jgi:hypothetical protein
MSVTKTGLEFTSKVFPSAGDRARWDALSAAEQREFIESSEQAGFESGSAPDEALVQRLARVRATSN